VAGRSATLEERLRHYLSGGKVGPPSAERLTQWVSLLGGERLLRRRLSMSDWPSHLDFSDQALAPPDYSADQLPPWTHRLVTLLEAASKPYPFDHLRDPERPLPFEELHLAWASHFFHELEGVPGLTRLEPTAVRSMLRYLANQWCEQATPVLVQDFRLYLAQRDPLAAFDPDSAAASCVHYQAYIERLRQGHLSQICNQYPVLGRRLAEEYDRQLSSLTELLSRLDQDAPEVADRFGIDPERVTQLKLGIGDRHHDGRGVCWFLFGDGCSLIYKPRSLSKEAALTQLSEQITAGLEFPLRSLKTLLREDYGWMEFAQHAPCPDQAAVERCYYRLGALLGVVHGLRGDDCHTENLVVAGEHPFLIDAETFAQGSMTEREREDPFQRMIQELEDSVLCTGMLPLWVPLGPPGKAYDAGGLTGRGGSEMPAYDLTWKHINSDGMSPTRVARLSPHGYNTVLLGQQRTELVDYLPTFLKGFSQAYRHLLEARHTLLDQGSPLEALVHSPARFIPRPTRIYHNLLMRSHQAQYLKDGLDLSFHLEQLATTYLQDWTSLPDWIWTQEISQLQRLDVPYLAVDSQSQVLRGNSTPWIARSGELVTRLQLASLSEESLARQLDILGLVWKDIGAAGPSLPEASQPAQAERFLQSSLKLAEWFQAQAVADPKGCGVRWRSVVPAPQETRLQPGYSGPDLYAGSLGVAIFLAAAARAGAATGELAMTVLETTEQHLHRQGTEASGSLFEGSLGWIYAALRVAHFLDCPDLLQRARRMATVITQQGDGWDVGAGLAGRILTLTSLGELDLRAETNALIAHKNLDLGGWGEEPCLGGFAHGSAGVAAALFRVGATDQAVQALQHQRSLATDIPRPMARLATGWVARAGLVPGLGRDWPGRLRGLYRGPPGPGPGPGGGFPAGHSQPLDPGGRHSLLRWPGQPGSPPRDLPATEAT
jgi:type 2 lantibiotic biosynthesis protein LanM